MTLRERRKAAGLRQIDVAKKLNVDQAAVSNWERGTSKVAKKNQKKLARLYRCKISDLITDDREVEDHDK